MAGRKAAGTPATVALAKAGVHYVVHEYEHDPANTHFGDESVAALGVDATRVFKTLVVHLVGGREATVCVLVPVAGQLDLKALAQAAGVKKAMMADAATAERLTGYVVGGISPFGHKRQLPVYVDVSAQAFPTILVSGGRRGMSVEVAAEDLVALLAARLARLARP